MFTIVGRCPFHRGSRRFVRLREAAGLYPPASKPLPRQHGVGCGLQRDASQYSTLARSPSVAGAVATKSRGRRETLSSFSLDGGVCVITGGAQGLGLAMGRAVVQSGADLAIVDLNYEEAKKQAGLLIDEYKLINKGEIDRTPTVTAHEADVADPLSVSRCVSQIIERHGRIDHLITSAGIVHNHPATEYPVDLMRRLWAVNVDGTYFFATAVARHLMERRAPGSMVLIGSMSGAIVNVPQPQAPYNMSKAAIRQLVASLAVEWAPKQIRVNCISPGYMATPLAKAVFAKDPSLRDRWLSMTPMGRMGVPDDLVGPVVFLLSDASSYMTGADIRVDGGYTVM